MTVVLQVFRHEAKDWIMCVPDFMTNHPRVVEKFHSKPNRQPAGGAIEKVRGSPKSVGLIIWEP